MEVEKQLKALAEINTSFSDTLLEWEIKTLKTSQLEILQLNIGKKCNLKCRHCHVNAGPDRTEMMSKEVFESALDLIKHTNISTLDITGGSPEMNPNLEWFLNRASKTVKKVIVRSNLVILKEEPYKKFIDIYSNNNIEIVASLPHYIKDQTDKLRGTGTFNNSIEVIKELNKRGYGIKGSGKTLNFVHNPVGAFLPGDQKVLEDEFKIRLNNMFNIQFNGLFCITNMPLGRYLEFLKKTENYQDYMDELVYSFNPSTAQNVMCKNTLNVSWDGTLYNCDFNQMLRLEANFGKSNNLLSFNPLSFANKEIVVKNHCFGCTAGMGSSCQGTIG